MPGDARGWLQFAEVYGDGRANAEVAIDVLAVWFRDVAVAQVGQGGLINSDLSSLAEVAATRVSPASLHRRAALLDEARNAITQRNGAVRLQLERMLDRDALRSVKSPRKIAFLSSLYFVQGLPFGFQANALPNYLRASGVSLTGIGLASALALPWALKAFWAPAVDRLGSEKFGRRKSWIVPLQGAMALSCCVAAWLPPSAALTPLLILILLLNLFAATQDIAVDGLAVELLGEKELGLGNAAQVVGYKLGMLTGGGLLVAASRFVGWQGLFLAMAALCLGVMFVTYRFRESSEVVREHHDGPPLKEVLSRMLASFKLPGAGWLLIFIATYKLGEVMARRCSARSSSTRGSKSGAWGGGSARGEWSRRCSARWPAACWRCGCGC